MSLFALVLVVLAAFIHATWNLLAKRAASAGPAFVFVYSTAAAIAYFPWVAWLLATEGLAIATPAVLACIMLSGAFHLAYSLCLQRGYQVADLTVVYPIARGTGPLLSSIGAFVLLGEQPTLWRFMGLLAIVAGIVLISTQGQVRRFFQPEAQKGVRWGSATGGMIAGYTVVDAYGVKMLGIQPVVLDWCSNVIRICLMMPWLLAHRARFMALMKGYWWLGIAVGVLSPLSYILVLTALKMGAPLSVVAPTREMSMMVGALFGLWFLRERVNAWRLTGFVVMIGGVILLSTGANKL